VEFAATWQPVVPQTTYMHKECALPMMGQSAMLEHIRLNPYDFKSHVLLRVQRQKERPGHSVSYAAAVRPMEMMLTSYNNQWIEYAHELLVDGRLCKPFIDVDLKKYMSAAEERDFLRQLSNELTRVLGWDCSGDNLVILKCFYPPSMAKTSFHIILNSMQHYVSRSAQWRHMINEKFDCAGFGVDDHLYSGTKSLRAIGSSKWIQGMIAYPFILLNSDYEPEYELTMDLLKAALVQYVPSGSHEIDVEESQSVRDELRAHVRVNAELNRAIRVVERGDPRLNAVVAWLRAKFTPGSATSISNPMAGKTRFHYSGCCAHGVWVVFDSVREVLDYQCSVEECWSGKRFFHGYGLKSERYQKMVDWIDWLDRHGLARADLPLSTVPDAFNTYTTFGQLGFDLESFFYRLRNNFSVARFSCTDSKCSFCNHACVVPPEYCDLHTSMSGHVLFSIDFFEWIRDEFKGMVIPDRTLRLLHAYVRLFFGINSRTDRWFVRAKGGLSYVNKSSVKDSYFGNLFIMEPKEKGRGENKTIEWIKKPYFKYFESCAWSSFIYEQVNDGYVEFYPGAPFNTRPGLTIDLMVAHREFLDSSPSIRAFCSALWKRYLTMCVFNEPESKQGALAKQLHRWVCEVAFEVGKPHPIILCFYSGTGGQGKSSLGELLCQIFGPQGSSRRKPEDVLGGFTEGGNGFLFFDEAILTQKTAEALKSLVTSKKFIVHGKFQKPYETANATKVFITTNIQKNVKHLFNSEKERRTLAFCLPETSILMNSPKFIYTCEFCATECEHSFRNHQEMMMKFHYLVLSPMGGQTGRYFKAFVGMLLDSYKQLVRNGHFNTPMQQELLLTKATLDLQINHSNNLAALYMDKCVNHRKTHWSPFLPPRLNTVMTIRSVDCLRLGNTEETPVWEEKVTDDAIFADFLVFCDRDGIKSPPTKQEFFDQLEWISLARRQKSLYPSTSEKGYNMVYKVQMNTDRPHWVKQSDIEINVDVLDVGKLEEWKRTKGAGDRVLPLSKRPIVEPEPEVEQPTAPVSDDDESSSSSSSSSFVDNEEYDNNRLAKLQFRNSRNSSTNFFNCMPVISQFAPRVQEDDNALFMPVCLLNQSDEVVDEDEQDRQAYLEDERAEASLKRKRAAGVDIDAVESDIDEEELPPKDKEEEDPIEQSEEEGFVCAKCGKSGATKRLTSWKGPATYVHTQCP